MTSTHQRRSVTRAVEGPLAGFDALLAWVVRLIWLNFWWLLLTLTGGILLGIGPATVAAYQVALAWVRGDRDLSVPQTMWTRWRQAWWPATRSTLLLTAMGAAVGVTWWMSRSQAPITAGVIQGIALLISILLVVVAVHLIWVIARDLDQAPADRLPIAHQFATALAIGIGRPVLSIVLLGSGTTWNLLLLMSPWPALVIISGISVPMITIAWTTNKTITDRLHTTQALRPPAERARSAADRERSAADAEALRADLRVSENIGADATPIRGNFTTAGPWRTDPAYTDDNPASPPERTS
jgi:uncharacterized membrane protein YesL